MTYQQKRRISFALSHISYWALIAYLLFSPLAFTTISFTTDPTTTGTSPLLIGIIKALPLLGFATAIIKQNKRQLAWLCFTLLIYFTLTIAFWQPQSIMTIILISSCFICAMVHIRWHNRAIHGTPPK